MPVISWRGPRGWSRWHLVPPSLSTDVVVRTLCRLDVPQFAQQSTSGPALPDDERVCLSCREQYGVEGVVERTLALLEQPPYRQPSDRLGRVWPWVGRVGIAISPLLAVLAYDYFVTPPLHEFADLGQDIVFGLGASGINVGIIGVLVRRIMRITGTA